MARKLKSDKVLFFATLLLVFASIVMVYSASAVMAMERFHRPYLFLIKQSMWAALGLAALAIVMRVDYRAVPPAGRHLGVAGRRRRGPVRWCCSARPSTARGGGSASAASACSRRSWRSWR